MIFENNNRTKLPSYDILEQLICIFLHECVHLLFLFLCLFFGFICKFNEILRIYLFCSIHQICHVQFLQSKHHSIVLMLLILLHNYYYFFFHSLPLNFSRNVLCFVGMSLNGNKERKIRELDGIK